MNFLAALFAITGALITFGGLIGLVVMPPVGVLALVGGLCLIFIGGVVSRIGSTKICPACAERIQRAALRCKHCGREFTSPLQARA
jgi:hypothetical protein